MVDKLNPIDKGRIRSLALKGFTDDGISKITNFDLTKVKKETKNINTEDLYGNSQEFYSELQKDLSKLVLTEMNSKDDKGNSKRDANVILNAIKLQAELQEKKLSLKNIKPTVSKISKDFLVNRDNEIYDLFQKGMVLDNIATKMNLSPLGVKDAIDRVKLNLPEELRALPPSIISETRGLPREKRIEILEQAKNNNMTRAQIRELMINIKNSLR